jgi:predicted protein tyrosine phosphatase
VTKTEEIFKTNGCPFHNHSQGGELRVVFVCSAGLLRSPTAARIAGEYGINARSAGSHLQYALIPVSMNLIEWADKVVFMNSSNEAEVAQRLYGDDLRQLQEKTVVWNIEDSYKYMEEPLVQEISKELDRTFNLTK